MLSLVVHAIGGLALVTRDGGASASATAEFEEFDSPPEATPVGIAESSAMTLDWLGFADPTPQSAEKAESNQAALAPDPSDADAPDPAEAAPAPTPQPQDPQTPTEPSESPTEQQPDPTPDPAQEPSTETPSETEPAESQAAELTVNPAKPGDEAVVPTDATPTPPETTTPQTPPSSSPSEVRPETPPAEGSAPQTTQSGIPAIKDDRQSEATSTEPLEVALNGKPVAREGLRIQTVKPEFSIATRLTAAPRNPLVTVDFGADGRVRDVRFERDPKTKKPLDTGSPRVNEPVVNALYRWRASGPRIEALKERPRKADGSANTESVTVRIVLRR